MPRIFLFLLLFSCCNVSFGQKEVAKAYVDTLCSDYFFGRGYVKDGVERAAHYLKTELENIGAQPFFGYSYLQPFDHKVNAFVGKNEFTIGKKEQVLGIDFIPAGNSGFWNGRLNCVSIELPENMSEDFIKSIFAKSPEASVALAISHSNLSASKDGRLILNILSNAYPIIVYGHDKLTASVATQAAKYPVLHSTKNKIKNKQQVYIRIDQELLDYRSKNVAGMISGSSNSDEFVFITAHYDHLGGLDNKTFIPGANDNASGTAMVLNLAKYFKEHPPKNNLVFMFFAGEELGLLGSKYFVNKKPIPLSKIKFVLNLDLLGTGDDGFAVVNGTVYPDWMEKLKAANQSLSEPFSNIKLRGEAANSDHYWFSKNNVPAFFVYTMGGITAYHDIFDKAKTLPLSKYNEMFEMLQTFISNIE